MENELWQLNEERLEELMREYIKFKVDTNTKTRFEATFTIPASKTEWNRTGRDLIYSVSINGGNSQVIPINDRSDSIRVYTFSMVYRDALSGYNMVDNEYGSIPRSKRPGGSEFDQLPPEEQERIRALANKPQPVAATLVYATVGKILSYFSDKNPNSHVVTFSAAHDRLKGPYELLSRAAEKAKSYKLINHSRGSGSFTLLRYDLYEKVKHRM